LGPSGHGSTFSRRFLPFEAKRVGNLLVQKLKEGLKLKIANVQGFYLILFFFCVCFKVMNKCMIVQNSGLNANYIMEKI
jgi:hypothetical protein